MIDTILLLCVVASALISILLFISQRRLKKAVDCVCENIAGTYACLDYLKEEAENSHQALQHLIDRNEYQIVINKYNLSNTRLQLMLHRQYAINNEDYEGAGSLSQAIETIEGLLNDD